MTENWHEKVARLAHGKWEAEGRPTGHSQRHWCEAEREFWQSLEGAEDHCSPVCPRWVRLCWAASPLLWLAAAGLCLYLIIGLQHPGCLDFDPSKAPKTEHNWQELQQDVRVFNNNGDLFVKWNREEALKYSIDQVNDRMTYMLLAAAAVLGFLVKWSARSKTDVIGTRAFPLKASGAPPGTRTSASLTNFWLTAHGAFGLVFSMLCGSLGLLVFTNIGTLKHFSIHAEIRIWAAAQSLSFLASILISAVALHRAISRGIVKRKEAS